MAYKTITANTGGITGAAGTFVSAVSTLEDAMSTVTSALNGLRGEWAGDGHDSFENTMIKWNKDMALIRTDLDDIAKDVKQSGLSYEQLESAIQKAFTPR